MKRIIIIIAASLAALGVLGFLGIRIWGAHYLKGNISIAKSQYPGTAEDALIAYLLDTTNTFHNRTYLAIATLGQIQSKKAIPVLEKLSKNDPEGKTCYGKHNTVLCQREIYKALHAKEVNWFPLYPGLNK